jgi:hypothetical protein
LAAKKLAMLLCVPPAEEGVLAFFMFANRGFPTQKVICPLRENLLLAIPGRVTITRLFHASDL